MCGVSHAVRKRCAITIKKGDTLGGIAKKFHCSVKQLKAWNNLTNDIIREGKKLKICK